MAELINTFSWSFSAACDFEVCRRKRYWSKYAAWGGWDANAPEIARKAYRLNKMDSRHTLQGRATEEAVRWILGEHQAGRSRTTEEAYETAARPLLNAAWKQSKSGAWRTDPKRNVCFHEHYYPALHKDLDPTWPELLKVHVCRCVGNFIETVLPRLASVRPEQEVPIGAPESFEWEGLTVYAVPDYVYRLDDEWHIHDWKAGKPRADHHKQLAVYGLWAHEKHGAAPDRIRIYIEYLYEGHVAMEPVTMEMLDEARALIRESATDMADYLHDGDARKNKPLPREEWDMTPDRGICARCNFYELCKPEFEE